MVWRPRKWSHGQHACVCLSVACVRVHMHVRVRVHWGIKIQVEPQCGQDGVESHPKCQFLASWEIKRLPNTGYDFKEQNHAKAICVHSKQHIGFSPSNWQWTVLTSITRTGYLPGPLCHLPLPGLPVTYRFSQESARKPSRAWNLCVPPDQNLGFVLWT